MENKEQFSTSEEKKDSGRVEESTLSNATNGFSKVRTKKEPFNVTVWKSQEVWEKAIAMMGT